MRPTHALYCLRHKLQRSLELTEVIGPDMCKLRRFFALSRLIWFLRIWKVSCQVNYACSRQADSTTIKQQQEARGKTYSVADLPHADKPLKCVGLWIQMTPRSSSLHLLSRMSSG